MEKWKCKGFFPVFASFRFFISFRYFVFLLDVVSSFRIFAWRLFCVFIFSSFRHEFFCLFVLGNLRAKNQKMICHKTATIHKSKNCYIQQCSSHSNFVYVNSKCSVKFAHAQPSLHFRQVPCTGSNTDTCIFMMHLVEVGHI